MSKICEVSVTYSIDDDEIHCLNDSKDACDIRDIKHNSCKLSNNDWCNGFMIYLEWDESYKAYRRCKCCKDKGKVVGQCHI
jgi:hypothetical protein